MGKSSKKLHIKEELAKRYLNKYDYDCLAKDLFRGTELNKFSVEELTKIASIALYTLKKSTALHNELMRI